MKHKIREWLLSLVREAVRRELEELNAKTDRVSMQIACLDARKYAAPKEADAKPKRPRTWTEIQEKLEAGEIDTTRKTA